MLNSYAGKKLYRIPEKGMLKGVCAGIAQYLNVPVKLVRLIVVLSMVFGLFFFTLVAYITLTFVLDPLPANATPDKVTPDNRDLLNEVDIQLAAGERRLRTMERYITSDTFTLRSRFRQL